MVHRVLDPLALAAAIASPCAAAPLDLCVNPGGTGGCLARRGVARTAPCDLGAYEEP